MKQTIKALRLLLLLVLLKLPNVVSAELEPCPGGLQRYWTVVSHGVYFLTPEEACKAYDLSEVWAQPNYHFIYFQASSRESQGMCFHASDASQSLGVPVNIINVGAACRDYIPPADKNDGCSANQTNHPCDVATGNKFRVETDISDGLLTFTRYYNSRPLTKSLSLTNFGLGEGWRGSHQKSIVVSAATDHLTLISTTGRGETWTKVGSIWQGNADSDYQIMEDSSGFQVTSGTGTFENYNLNGQRISETDPNGNQTLYSYDADGNLSQIANHYNHTLTFTYLNGNLKTVTDPLGAQFSYEYDTNNNLVAVVFPDTTPTDYTDNPRKIYHYENVDFPNHLTGITDENGDRHANFVYDTNGKVVLSELGTTSNTVGQERIELDY